MLGRRAHLPIARDLGISNPGPLGPIISSVIRNGIAVTFNVPFGSGATALLANAAVSGGLTLSSAGFAVLLESDSSLLTIAPISPGVNSFMLPSASYPGSSVRVR